MTDIYNKKDPLLFQIFKDITLNMAIDYEVNNRDHAKDSRRKIFSKQKELLKKFNNKWEKKIAKRHSFILSKEPYRD